MTDSPKSQASPVPPRSKALPDISTRLARIATLAQQAPKRSFLSLAHNIDLQLLRKAYEYTNLKAAPGVDGTVASTYARNLDQNLQLLMDRMKSGLYRAPAVRRVHIPKGHGGETRPIGIPTVEDKVLQRAVLMLLEQVYEQDFLDCSYGFRPGVGAHDALQAIYRESYRLGGCWLVEVDIRSFFDTLDHAFLRDLIQLRIRDGVICRLLHKWLKAGVLEDGALHFPTAGSPQGGVISPLLANIYLHYVLDVWFYCDVLPRMKGGAFLVRYADDFVVGFKHREDAERFMRVLPKRFARFGLELHPGKTQLVDFRKPDQREGEPNDSPDEGPPTSFDFLAFRHKWTLSRRKRWTVRQTTAPSRFTRALRKVSEWCERHRHLRVETQHEELVRKVRGHYGYFGITGNFRRVQQFHHQVERVWRKWLDRRSQGKHMPWDRFQRLLRMYPLPRARIVHCYYVP